MKKESKKGETGYENAKRFVAYVIMMARSSRHIVIYQDKWPWMLNADWRAAVYSELAGHTLLIDRPQFHEPDALSAEYSFSARSTVPSTIIENLELTDTVEPDRLVTKEQAKKICWFCFLVLGVVVAAAVGSCHNRNVDDAAPITRSI